MKQADAKMLVIALTGGIGSGKTQVGNRFAELGISVIDADILARELVQPGMPALDAISRRFGPEMLTTDGQLDRARLRALVFHQLEARAQLEAILHPRIEAEMKQRVAQADSAYAIVVIPLLLETGQTHIADRILLVDVPEALQIERVQGRDGQTKQQVQAILSAQTSRSVRLAAADDIIDNSGSIDQLIQQTDTLHHQYLALAQQLPQ